MPTTSNFGWTTPADTDLVKDGAAAIRTLGNGIDTSFIDLKGGTTGQILAKASNTDLDFSWIANDQGDITAVTAGTGITGGGTTGAVTITNDMATTITASGDIVVGTGNATYDNLPIGTTGQVLTADTTVSPYKVKWATPSSGAVVQVVTAVKSDTFTTSASNTWTDVTGLSATITPTSASNKILVISAINMGGRVGVNPAAARLVRGSTAIALGDAAGNRAQVSFSTYISSDDDYVGLNGHSFIDSPATTSATTYKWQVFQGTAAGTVYVNRGQADADNVDSFRSSSQIILLEVTP